MFCSLNYEGENLNGKKNEKGKEYELDLLIFEDGFKNDKRWKGKEYNPSHDIVYQLNNYINFY